MATRSDLLSPQQEIETQHEVFSRPLGNLVFDKTELFEVDGDSDTVSDAVQHMNEKGVLALPLFRKSTLSQGIASAVEQKTYHGYVSTYDVMVALSEEHKHTKDIKECVAKLYNKPCYVLIRSPESGKIAVYEPTTIVRSVFDILSNPDMHIHRILVEQSVDSQDKTTTRRTRAFRMLEQEDIIRHMMYNLDKLGSFVQRSVKELGMLKNRTVISMNDTDTALHGIEIMVSEDVNAIAVVNKAGEVMSTFSSSDMRNLTVENANSLNMPVMDYLKTVHFGEIPAPVTCTSDTQLHKLMSSAQMHGVFRIWVVDGQRKPVNVITLTDILQQFSVRSQRPAGSH